MVRKATVGDLDEIFSIYNKVKLDRTRLGDSSYAASIQRNGFLLGLDDRGTLEKELSSAYEFLVAEQETKIVGYLIADHAKEQKFYDDEYKTWFDLQVKDFYYQSPKGMSIESVVIDPDYSRKGIADQLLQSLERKLRNEFFEKLFSIVTIAPVTNCPTIVWHTKNGFKRLAMGKPRERFFDLDWYSGVLLYKNLV